MFHVAVVNGVALGWGTEHALTADYRIGCDESVWSSGRGSAFSREVGGTSELWSHIGLPQALRLGMTGGN